MVAAPGMVYLAVWFAVAIAFMVTGLALLRKVAVEVKASPGKTTRNMILIWAGSFLLIRFLMRKNLLFAHVPLLQIGVYTLGFILPFLSYYFWLKDQLKPRDFQKDIDEIGSSNELRPTDKSTHD